MKSRPHPERPDRIRAIAASLATAGILSLANFCFRLGIWLIPVSRDIQEMWFWSLQVYFREDAIQFPLEKLHEKNLRWLVANFLNWALKCTAVILLSLYPVILYCIRCFHLKILSRKAQQWELTCWFVTLWIGECLRLYGNTEWLPVYVYWGWAVSRQ